MKVLMVGVDKRRLGGMWSVAEKYINSKVYNEKVKLKYVATSTCGNIFKRTLKMLTGFIKIFWNLIFSHIDIVHIHMAEKGSTFRKGFVVKMSRLFKKKIIVHLHAGPFMRYYNSVNLKKQKKIRKIFSKCDKILVLGDYWKKELSSIVDIKKIDVLYNGVKISSTNNFNVDSKIISYFGLIKKEKGVYDLINAIKLIDEKIPTDYKFYICGNDCDGIIVKMINDFNLTSRIVLTGWINQEKVFDVLSRTLFTILPSYFEGLSMTLLESIANGIPIVTTKISTSFEITNNDYILFEPGDIKTLATKILELINNKELTIKLSDELYSRAKNIFSVDKMILKTLDIYNDL